MNNVLINHTPDPAPIDRGLGLLAAAGGVYAFKKIFAGQDQLSRVFV